MTVEEITENLKVAAQEALRLPVILAPQAASGTVARVELLFLDCAPNGEGGEKLLFEATYATNGTHKKWLTETIRLRRRLRGAETSFVEVPAGELGTLRAYWQSRGEPRWVYPSEDESPMPAEYTLRYGVELDIPSNILED